MKRIGLKAAIVVLGTLVFALADGIASQGAVNVAYTIVDIGTLGGNSSRATDINENGVVVGYSSLPGNNGDRPFVYDPGAPGLHNLGTLGLSGFGQGINDAGEVTGYFIPNNGFGFPRAFLYDGTFHDLGILGGGIFGLSFGWDISNSGNVAGDTTIANGDRHAFFYDGAMHDLGTLDGSFSQVVSINDADHMAGSSAALGDTANHAFLYDGTLHDLGTLGGRDSQATSLNNLDQVVGYSSTPGDVASHAFFYDPGAPGMHDLGTLGGATSVAFDVNDVGHVVGTSDTAGGGTSRHAFLYKPGSGMVDLNALIDPLAGWQLTNAEAINDAGLITGDGIFAGQSRAYLLVPLPVPEPHGIALAAIGLGCVLVGRNCFFRHRCDV